MIDALPDPLWLVDIIIAVVIVEFAAVSFYAWRRGSAPLGLAANLTAGACLLMTARAALTGDRVLFLVMLAAAGIAHSLDVLCRWYGQRGTQ